MLTITIKGDEVFNHETEEFSTVGDLVVNLEHSLVSLSKWESIWEIPFLDDKERTPEQVLSYIRCMAVDSNVPEDFPQRLSQENLNEIVAYIDKKNSATWFSDNGRKARSAETITSELIYYWMTGYNIPLETETWHLTRLFNLIRVCALKQEKPKKMSRSEIARRNRELNARRKAQLGTSG